MDLDHLTTQLARQAEAIHALVQDVSDDQARWKPSPDDWSILEVIHHLYDEEIEDFRAISITFSSTQMNPGRASIRAAG